MTDEHGNKAEIFLDLFNKGKAFTEELLEENKKLRYQIAKLEQGGAQVPAPSVGGEVEKLRAEVERLKKENEQIQERFALAEEENRDFAERYIEIEEQNNNLANLYVASYQLHSTLDFREVIQIVQEIVINLVGAEVFVILLKDESTGELKPIESEGNETLPGMNEMVVRQGEGTLGEALDTGESVYEDPSSVTKLSLDTPIAAVPLKIKDHVIGMISIYKLLQQKDTFTAVDYELFSLLAAHSATAIYSSKLYSTSERKLNTIQSFLDLLTTG